MQDTNTELGVIHPDQLYTLTAFTRQLGIRAATLRSARRAGLKVYYVHKHGYVYGRDWIDYVRGVHSAESGKIENRSQPTT